ncbi:DUF1311 domain-containing protein [Burkholderiaceae bacterium DAT-1]|nr:DUF1311 domain-containing protein [Burkholderiaceae bacterium DAT-1]
MQVSKCVLENKKNSEKELLRVEGDLRAALLALPNDLVNRKQIRSGFDVSSRTFKKYRAAQCKFQEEISFGMYAEEFRLACETELNSRRTDELNSVALRLK